MISFRRACLLAACLLTFLFLLQSTRSATPAPSPFAESSTSTTTEQSEPARDGSSGVDSGSKVYTTGAATPFRGATRKPTNRHGSKTSAEQHTLSDMGDKSLSEQLDYQFPYDAEGKFPGYIWQTWKVTPASGEFEEKYRRGEASWTETHPGFVHEVITDQVAVHLIRHLYAAVPAVLEAYQALPVPVMKADFFRYLILLARGGIYTDIDTMALKSAAEWVPEAIDRSSYGLVIGIEADPDRPDWRDWYSRRIQFCQWTIQSKPGHPVLRNVIVAITEETLRRKKEGLLSDHKELQKHIVELTGPALWTDKIFDFFNDAQYFDMSASQGNISYDKFTGMTEPKRVGDVIVLPITSFSPGIKTMGAGSEEHPMAFVKHDFDGTWKPEEERHIGKIDEPGHQ